MPDLDDPMDDSKKIKIVTVTGGNSKDDLIGCYFYPVSIVYFFYSKEDDFRGGGFGGGGNFEFLLNGSNWRIGDPDDYNALILSQEAASGTWLNEDTGESGTFQAQAGASMPEE